MAKRIIMINNGKIEIYPFSNNNLKLCENSVNPDNFENYICFDCKNASPHKCQKIYDKKKKITNYPFITKGYQKGNYVAIYECKNFINDSKKDN